MSGAFLGVLVLLSLCGAAWGTKVAEVRVEGADSSEVRRLLGVRPGEEFVPARLESGIRKVLSWYEDRGHPFAKVEVVEASLEEDGLHISLRVDEGPEVGDNRFSAALGYAGGEVLGELSLSLRNPWGRGRRLEARWSRRSSCTELNLSYREPRALGLPLSLKGEFEGKLRERYSNLSGSVSASLPAGPAEVGMSVGRERTVRDSVGEGAWGLGFGLTYTKGHLRVASEAWWYPGREEGARLRVGADVEWRRPVAHGLAIVGGLHFRAVEGRRLSPYDLIPLGGARSLRGYREEQFRGRRVLWTKLELRRGLGGGSFTFPFLDIGYVRGRVRLGYGVGLRLETKVGLVGVDYGLSPGDGPLQGKVHLSLEGRF